MNPFLPLPLPLPQTYAPWPVWSDSTTAPIRFQPMPKKAAVRLWHRALISRGGISRLAGKPATLALRARKNAIQRSLPHGA
jgi:hypothetical protein